MLAFKKAFKRYPNVPPWLAIKQTRQESQFNPNAVSPAGAISLMQLMPATAKTLKVDPWNKEQNIMGGVAYESMLIEKYKSKNKPLIDVYEEAMLAYNGGHAMVQAKRAGYFYQRKCNYHESKTYIRIILNIKKYPWLPKSECDRLKKKGIRA
jgi:soluble lytic murein transglycosylase-like protein